MIVSSKVRYATRALIQLAHHAQAGPLSVREIGRQEGLSDKYLESVLAQLKAAGIVESRKGKHGGYLLARPAEQVSLHQIIRVFEAGVVIEQDSPHSDTGVWRRVRTAVERVLEETSLADAARDAFEYRGVLNYSI